MSTHVRAAIAGALAVAALALGVPAAQAAFGVTEAHFEAGTCSTAECTYSSPKADFYTEAAGHPERGITSVELNSKSGLLGVREPEGALKRLRVDVPPGLAANPEALPTCSKTQFESEAGCPTSTKVGETQLEVFVLATDVPVTGE